MLWQWIERLAPAASIASLPLLLIAAFAPLIPWIKRHETKVGLMVGFIALSAFAYAIDVSDRFGLFKSNPGITNIYSESYANEVVVLDNKDFHDCSFSNVTFQYSGGGFYFDNARFTGAENITVTDAKMANAVLLLKVIGALKPDFAASWHS